MNTEKRLISWLLSLVLLLSLFPVAADASTRTADEPDVTFVGASLSLKGDIGLNYYVSLSEKLLSDDTAYMRFTGSGAERQVAISQGAYDPSDDSYRYSIPLNAKNMGDNVTAQVCDENGAVGEGKSLSIKYYADYVINNSSKEPFVNLMKSMLNYGAAAQVNFGYDTENLVNADMAESDRALSETLDVAKYAHTWSGEEEGIEVTNASLLLQSETKIRIYFKPAEGKALEDFTFTIDGMEVTPVQSGDEYYIEKANVAAKDLDTMYTFCLGERQLTYCGLSYVNQVVTNSKNENLLNLAKALYTYNQAANDYFQPAETEPPHTHKYSEVVTKPTCTEKGYTTYTCSCGDSYKGNEKPATGHAYQDKVTAPTCDKDGYTTHTCRNCGDSYTDTVVKATGHNWGNWVVTKEATVDAEGEETRTCGNCGKTETRKTEKLPAETEPPVNDGGCTEHSWGAWTSDWNGSYRSCEKCGEQHIVDGSNAQFVSEVVTYVNEYRVAAGLAPLTESQVQFGLIRAEEITIQFNHLRLNGKNHGTGECIATGSSAKSVVDAWYNSSSHNGILLHKNATTITAARCGGYWVVLIG